MHIFIASGVILTRALICRHDNRDTEHACSLGGSGGGGGGGGGGVILHRVHVVTARRGAETEQTCMRHVTTLARAIFPGKKQQRERFCGCCC